MLEVINLLQTTYLDPGTVSVRVAFVLRSTEVIPAFSDLFPPPDYQPPGLRGVPKFDGSKFWSSPNRTTPVPTEPLRAAIIPAPAAEPLRGAPFLALTEPFSALVLSPF